MSRKILYLASAIGLTLDQSGGAGTHMRGTISGFSDNGFEVLPLIGGDILGLVYARTSFTSVHDSNKKISLRNSIKRFLPTKVRLLLRDIRIKSEDYRFERKTIDSIKAFAPEAIYERSGYLSTIGSRLSRKLGVPLFFETDGCMVEIISQDYGVFSKRIGNWIEKWKMKRADYIVVLNKFSISAIKGKFYLENKVFIVKPLGVEVKDFKWNEEQILQLRDKYHLQDKFVIGFVGAISTYHGVQYLIEAAEYLLAGKGENIVIMIVGWSKEGEVLKRKAEERGLTNVIFTGNVDKSQVANYYKLFNVGVIPDCEPSIYPIKVLEYGLLNLCPLAPEYEVFKEIIFSGKTGYYFTPRDSKSLAETIIRISKNREEAESCAENWQTYVKSNFEWKDAVKGVVDAINSLNGRIVDEHT